MDQITEQPPHVESPQQKHTIRNSMLWTIVGIFAIMLVIFIGYTGYYVVRIAGGNVEDIQKDFESKFTTDASLQHAVSQTNQNPATTIRPHNPTFGLPEAPITIIAFLDFECPFCQEAHTVFEDIRVRYQPAVRVVFKHFPVSIIHPNALPAALAAQCAHEQGHFWEYYQIIFEQKRLGSSALAQYAQTLPINQNQFIHCVESNQYEPHVMQDYEDGLSLGVRGTPTYFLNNTKIEGVLDTEDWDGLILNTLQNVPRNE